MKRALIALAALSLTGARAPVPDLSGTWQLEEGQSTTFANTAPGQAEARKSVV